MQSGGLLLFGAGVFLAARFTQLELQFLALVEQGSALVANGVQAQAFADGFTDAKGIAWFAIDFKNSKPIQCAIGIFAGSNYTPQKDGVSV